MDSVKDYIEFVNAPWGRIFYDLLIMQLNICQAPKLNILDFGSGLGVTADYFAEWHDVTAVEPKAEMIENSLKKHSYTQISGGIEKLPALKRNSFDIVFCHNVLEYIEDKKPIVAELMRLLKQGGTLSVVKHNRIGKVFHSAVFRSSPKKAIDLLDSHSNDKSNYLGTQYIYSNSDIIEWAGKCGGKIRDIYGMRTFWALGQDNNIKYTDEWYLNMLLLESKVAEIEDYKQAAFYNHLLIEKIK
ncbi:MAG: class I SAM-dependent methyltransferase [Clostridiales bacterium]|jgi:ubiquinone/menaquinone biosynthesis C-methylase UbiE|nr:class I SAM-dependent methyltransferase [Clostridiales bacterium]